MNIRTLTALAGIVGAVTAGIIGGALGITNQLWIAVTVGVVGVVLMALAMSRDDITSASSVERRVNADID